MTLKFEGTSSKNAGHGTKERESEKNKKADLAAELAITNWFEALDEFNLSENDKKIIINAAVDDPEKFLSGKYEYFISDPVQNQDRSKKFNDLVKNSVYNNFNNWLKRSDLDIDPEKSLKDAFQRIVQKDEFRINNHTLRLVSEMRRIKEKAERIQGQNIKYKNF
jgi:hypothetical protein